MRSKPGSTSTPPGRLGGKLVGQGAHGGRQGTQDAEVGEVVGEGLGRGGEHSPPVALRLHPSDLELPLQVQAT